MRKQNNEELQFQLKNMGFAGRWGFQLQLKTAADPENFLMTYITKIRNDRMEYILHFERDSQRKEDYRLFSFDAILRKEKAVPHLTLNGVDTSDLDKRMKSINWKNDYFNQSVHDAHSSDAMNQELDNSVFNILRDFWRIDNKVPDGNLIQNLLQQKYWLDTPFEQM